MATTTLSLNGVMGKPWVFLAKTATTAVSAGGSTICGELTIKPRISGHLSVKGRIKYTVTIKPRISGTIELGEC